MGSFRLRLQDDTKKTAVILSKTLPTTGRRRLSWLLARKKTINVSADEFLKEIRHSINYLDKNLKKIKIVIE